MQSRRELITWRFETVRVGTRHFLEDLIDRPRLTELGLSTTLGRAKWIETQCHGANHRCCSARNPIGLSCFSSGRFQGLLFKFLCLFLGLRTSFSSILISFKHC